MQSFSVLCIPTRGTHITSDMCAGVHISRGYTYHCDSGHNAELSLAKITPALQDSSEKVQGHSIESFLYFIEGPKYQFQGEIGFPA